MDLIGINSKQVLIGGIAMAGIIGINLWLYYGLSDDEDKDIQDQQVRKPAGIYNEGNTCFVNSLLQALASMDNFKENITHLLENSVIISLDEKVLQQLLNVIQKINSNTESISIVRFLQHLSRLHNNIINFQQQDAHQLFTLITRSIDNLFNNRKTLNLSKSAIQQNQLENILQGWTRSSITCLGCQKQTKISVDVFYNLSLQIEPNFVRTLDSALKWYERQEFIDNWICCQCSVNNHITKLRQINEKLFKETNKVLKPLCSDLIEYLNKILIGDEQLSQIKSRFSQYALKYQKQYDILAINHPMIHQIFSQIVPVHTRIAKKLQIIKFPVNLSLLKKILVIHFKQLCMNPRTGELRLLRKPIEINRQYQITLRNGKRKYKLTSLLTHVGNQSMGHYFTFRKINKQSENWYVISDTSSRQCNWSYLAHHIPYMLFYQAE